MKEPDFTHRFTVNKPAEAAFAAVLNVRGWWSEDIEGPTDQLNAEFFYHYKELHRCNMRLVELVPNQRVVWLVLENHFSFLEEQQEWVNTRLVFDLQNRGDETEIRFVHEGLTPADQCYDVCEEAWTNYIGTSLKELILTGKGRPNEADTERDYNALLADKKGLSY